MNLLSKAYYHLTAYIPRKLPRTEAEYKAMKDVLLNAYGVIDDPATWATVSGQVTSVPATKLRKPWGHIANAAKRLKINELSRDQMKKAMDDFNDKLAIAVKKVSDALKEEEIQKNEQITNQEQPETNEQSQSQGTSEPSSVDGPEPDPESILFKTP